MIIRDEEIVEIHNCHIIRRSNLLVDPRLHKLHFRPLSPLHPKLLHGRIRPCVQHFPRNRIPPRLIINQKQINSEVAQIDAELELNVTKSSSYGVKILNSNTKETYFDGQASLDTENTSTISFTASFTQRARK